MVESVASVVMPFTESENMKLVGDMLMELLHEHTAKVKICLLQFI